VRIVLFCHSLLSDWNHGNAHFLRGLVSEFGARGHSVTGFESVDAWSAVNLIADRGRLPVVQLRRLYPHLHVVRYKPEDLDLDQATEHADVVMVHEWNEPSLVRALGQRRKRGAPWVLLFHDTHHRAMTEGETMGALDLSGYDGVLAFGEALRERYLAAGWSRRVFTFHEAADTRVFGPRSETTAEDALVWVGNFGVDERTQELDEFLLGPAKALGLSGSVYGVRYPAGAQEAVSAAGLRYRGFAPNFRVPEIFARHRMTVHVPRRPYVSKLPGIPTIRVFEALACGIPLVSAPWSDCEGLFREGDFLWAHNGAEMKAALSALLGDPDLRAQVAAQGRATVLQRHTCAHRADQLLSIAIALGVKASPYPQSTTSITEEMVHGT
jgi:spore maturation protein CgeB